MLEPKNWKRLLLEVVIIVGSILLAFVIEAWWSGQQDQEELEALVALLRDDIATQIADFERQNERDSLDLTAMGELNDIIYRVSEQPTSDSMAVLLRTLYRSRF